MNTQRMNFGQYAGKTYQEVLEKDFAYLVWAKENTNRLPQWVREEIDARLVIAQDPDVPVNKDQQAVLDAVLIERVSAVVMGAAGTGKSQIVKAIKGERAIRIAPTGIASTGINGRTFHSVFLINPKDPLVEAKRSIERHVSLVVMDESFYTNATLLHRGIEAVKAVNPNAVFLFMGDYGQLLPVHADTDKKALLELDEEEQALAEELAEWKGKTLFDVLAFHGIKYRAFQLTKSMRHGKQETFEIMAAAREGKLTPAQLKALNARVKPKPKNAFELVLTNAERKKLSAEYLNSFAASTKFSIKKAQVVNIKTEGRTNEERLEAYLAKFPKLAFLRGSLKRSGFNFQPETLAIGCQIMVIRNDRKLGVVNGDLGTVLKYNEAEEVVTCRINRTNDVVDIGRVFHGFESKDKVVKIGLAIYPLRLASVATIHKVQGITVDGPLHIHVCKEMRSRPGLLYTALTRVRDISQVTLSAPVTNSHFYYDKRWAKIVSNQLTKSK